MNGILTLFVRGMCWGVVGNSGFRFDRHCKSLKMRSNTGSQGTSAAFLIIYTGSFMQACEAGQHAIMRTLKRATGQSNE